MTSKSAASGDNEEVPLPGWVWTLRLLWIAVQIILVLWFGQKGVQFVYQGF